MKLLLFPLVILCSFCVHNSFSQSVAINTTGSTASASAMLDVSSTVKGMLIPRMSRTERNAIASPATGLLIFQSSPDSVGFYYYNGSTWTWMFSNSNADSLAWRTRGNASTVDGNNFIGTTDNIPFNIRVNNQKAGRIDHINWNTFLGYQAGNAITSAIHNTAVGYQAFFSNQSGNNNTAIGTVASNSNTTGGENTSMGYASQVLNTVGNGNTAYGFYSLYNNVAGSFATAIGYQCMLYANNTSTPFINTNVAVGHESMKGNAPASGNTGLNNTAIGYQSLWSNSTGNNNTANGYYALRSNSLGSENIAVGSPALFSNTTSGHNVAVGNNALYTQSFNNGSASYTSDNVAIGDSSMYTNNPTVPTNGSQNTAVGNQTLRNNSTGYQNVALGNLALYNNTNGNLNTASGWASLYKNNGATYNTASGAMAMYYNTSGSYNTGIGALALHNNVSGSNNTVVGEAAGLGSIGNSYSNNTIMGFQAGYNLTTGSNNILIGYQAGYFLNTASDRLYIANSNVDPPLIYGDFSSTRIGLGTSSPGDKVEINGNLRFTGIDTVYAAPSTTGSGKSIWFRAGAPYVPVGGGGGSVYIEATNNMPSGGSGYGNLAASGSINLIAGSGYNTAGGNINITAGQTSYWALANDSHSDVITKGGYNINSTDAATLTTEGGHVISFDPSNSNGGNLLLKPGAGVGTGTNGYIQLDAVIAYGVSTAIAGGAAGSPVSLTNYKSYLGLSPANGTNNYYQLPNPGTYPGRMYIIRNNSSSFTAIVTTASGLLFPGSSNTGSATYTLNPTTSVKTVMAISDGSNWSILKQD